MHDLLRIAQDHQAALRAEAHQHRQAAKASDPDTETLVTDTTATRTAFRRPELVIGSVFPATR